jgi:hypothetical protein
MRFFYRATRHRRALASSRIPLVLAMEISLERRSAADLKRMTPRYERSDSPVGAPIHGRTDVLGINVARLTVAKSACVGATQQVLRIVSFTKCGEQCLRLFDLGKFRGRRKAPGADASRA